MSKPASLSGGHSGAFISGQLALIKPELDNDWLFRKEHRKLNRQIYTDLSKRRFGVFHVTFEGINFFFVCIERFNSDKFRTAIFRFSSRSDFLNALHQILVGIVDVKGVWKRASGIAGSNVSLITHRGDEVAIASQIRGKLEAAIES